MSDTNRIMFATTFLAKTAAIWWYTVVQSNNTPSTWKEFKTILREEFIPADHVRRSRKKLGRLRQATSVAKYLSDFWNLILTIPDMSEGEKLDRFTDELKYDIRVELLKSSAKSFDEVAQIALRIDDAVWNAHKVREYSTTQADKHTPMEIGNLETTCPNKDPKRKPSESQRDQDARVNSCFTGHKIGCRPWKHAAEDAPSKENENAKQRSSNESDTDSEN